MKESVIIKQISIEIRRRSRQRVRKEEQVVLARMSVRRKDYELRDKGTRYVKKKNCRRNDNLSYGRESYKQKKKHKEI